MNRAVCCQCEAQAQLTQLHGYSFCATCLSKLALHADRTILKNAAKYQDSRNGSYEDEVVSRLQKMDKDFAKNRVKLLHILERLSELT